MNYTIEQTNKCTKIIALLAYVLLFIAAGLFTYEHNDLAIIVAILSVVFWVSAKIAKWWDNS